MYRFTFLGQCITWLQLVLKIKTWFVCFLCIKLILHPYYNSYLALTVTSQKRPFRKGDEQNTCWPPEHELPEWTTLKWTTLKIIFEMITIQSYELLYLALLHARSLAAISPLDKLMLLSITRTKVYPAQHTLTCNSFFQCLWRNYSY